MKHAKRFIIGALAALTLAMPAAGANKPIRIQWPNYRPDTQAILGLKDPATGDTKPYICGRWALKPPNPKGSFATVCTPYHPALKAKPKAAKSIPGPAA